MNDINLINKIYRTSDKYNVILNVILFAHYCKSTLFYKDFFNVSRDILKVNKIANKNLKEAKKIIKMYGYKKVWIKGIFSLNCGKINFSKYYEFYLLKY